jgi:hypothetical protein
MIPDWEPEPKKRGGVYCEGCDYFAELPSGEYRCRCLELRKPTWLSPFGERPPHPSITNANNDCTHFKGK